MFPEADVLLADSSVEVKALAREIYAELAGRLACTSYVKTIYIGFEHQGEMVAALYPSANAIELALALPEDFESPLLIDATHLTWKTMPVAAVLQKKQQLSALKPLLKTAFQRVASGEHDVLRPNEYFADRVRGHPINGPRPFKK